jgi:hypothetical protein
MWLVCKQVGLFVHYLTPEGIFQPGLIRARKFPSLEMAEIMAKKHGGVVRLQSSGQLDE